MPSIFAGKKIVVGVTGSIAAFKVAGWVSELAKQEALVSVIMTEAASRFVTPLTFAALSDNRVYTRMFDDGSEESMAHINLGRDADAVLVAPATANTIARMAVGLADTLLTTTILASRAPVLVCPAMNSRMYHHQATRDNLGKLKTYGYTIIAPDSGTMACKEVGEGRLPEWPGVQDMLAASLSPQDLRGQTVLITAGPTREPIDPARFLSNRSSGKMGYALARACFQRGARVTLVSGPSPLACPTGVERVAVETAEQMMTAVMARAKDCSLIIKSAAVADYRPATRLDHKARKHEIESNLALTRNPDILHQLGANKRPGQILVGFAAQSGNLLEEGVRKLKEKHLDLIAVNDITGHNTGFETDTNQLLVVSAGGSELLPLTGKDEAANLLLDRIVTLLPSKKLAD